MEDVKKLLKLQIQIMQKNKGLLELGIQEVLRLLKLQAAEAKLMNARIDVMDGSFQKLIAGLDELGDTSKNLLNELTRK